MSTAAIRRFAEAHEMASPLFWPGPAIGSPSAVAPWAMLPSVSMPAYWAPGDPPIAEGAPPPLPWDSCGIPAVETVTSRLAFVYHQPLRPGDLVTTEYRVLKVVPKATRVGTGSFVEFDLAFLRQDGELLARERSSVYRYTPCPTPAGSAPARSAVPVAAPRAGATGVRLPPVRLDLTLQRLIMSAAASRDFAPVHIDPVAARASGAPGAYADVMLVLALFERLLTEWAGPGGEVRAIGDLRLRDFVLAGQTAVCTGTVLAAAVDAGNPGRVDVRVAMQIAQDDRVPVTAEGRMSLTAEAAHDRDVRLHAPTSTHDEETP